MRYFVCVLSLAFSLTASAEADKHPCEAVKKACEAAGFVKGAHKEKKGLWKDCMEPLASGTAVAGVTVSPEEIAACKEKKAEHKKYK